MADLSSALIALAGLFCMFICFVTVSRHTRHRGGPLPPGPAPLPVIGNLLDMPKERPWVAYRDWSHKYGDSFSILVYLRCYYADLGLTC